MTEPSWGRLHTPLVERVRALPRAGVHRWPANLTLAPRNLHPVGARVLIAEEHGGFAFGGNKVRQVDVLLGAALAAGANAVITSAGPQSNLCRVVAAAGAAAGVEVHLVLRGRRAESPSGNQLLYALTGATEHWLDIDDPFGDAQAEAMRSVSEDLRSRGLRPHILDVRGPEAGTTCALATTEIVEELAMGQARTVRRTSGSADPDGRPGLQPSRIVLAASAGNTAGGIVAALAARRASISVIAVSASGTSAELEARILERAAAVLDFVGCDPALAITVPLEVTDEQLGAGHGHPTEAATHAARHTARTCGIFLDPTYTAKAMAGLLADERTDPVLFLHTGGGPTLFTRTDPVKTQTAKDVH